MATTNDYYENRRKLEDEIAGLESVYTNVSKPKLPTVTLEEMKYTPPTDDELKASAEQSLAGYKSSGESAIRDGSAANAKELDAKRAAQVDGLNREVSALDGSYQDAAARVDADVIKRGLARSSIAVNAKSGLESEYLDRVAAVREDYGKRIAELDGDIASVGAKLTAALNDFNLSYAAKLNETLSKLQAEREEKAQAVIKYNNDIKAKQASLDAQRAKTESELYSEAIKQNQSVSSVSALPAAKREEVYKAVYDKLDAYLSALPASQARIEIRNYPMYRSHLSDFYYYKLYDKYAR